MKSNIVLSGVHFTAATDDQVSTGLLGYITATINDAFRIEGLTLRRTEHRRFTISYPVRTDRHGVEHHYLVPVNDEVRRDIERQILAALGHQEMRHG